MIRISSKNYLYEFVNYILDEAPDIVGLSCLDTSLLNTVVLSKAIKTKNNNIKIVLGGPGVFYNSSDLMNNFNFIDCCIIGEGEIAFENLIDYFNGKTAIDSVPGLVYRNGSKILTNTPATVMDINALPYLCFDLYDVQPGALNSINCETGRGCPYQCTFCSTTAFWGNRFRVKDPERMACEIKHYCRLYGKISHFDFHSHDNFLTNKKYIKQLFYELGKRNLKISWNCSSRIDQLDDEFVEILKQSGCNYIDCGPESGSSRIRKLINKDINYEATITNIEKLIRKGIGVAVNFMFGFPTETIEEMEETFEQACRCVGINADVVFCFLSPIKGTKIYEQFEQLLIDKAQDHIHDFTDTRVNYLFGTDTLGKEHPYFNTRMKMFSNYKEYDEIVEKIRSSDSVHIFIHLSKLLLALKQKFKIDLTESHAALRTFPYTEDLFKFALKQAKENSISAQAMAIVLYEANHEQGKIIPGSQFEDITLFILMDQLVRRDTVYLLQWDCFKRNAYNGFFKGFADTDIYPEFFEIDDFQLCSAFKITSLKTIFLRFYDKNSEEKILTGITLDKNQNKSLLYYKPQVNDKEIRFLKNLEKIIAGETYA
ncbi:MAG: B12-binding domain-containing radical SAM protein [Proteobacteria bacterium]|nr:B12-binding domain-containing radical SAM protein [Pseudomonadota bacterium]MBU1585698.1 B12-binding domain-containing radical SAM protein [Pseudomonadota bacterium]MBU2629209.1 B12-binding domain-containing radical SAM protein [Pseudomonadota bacterium]